MPTTRLLSAASAASALGSVVMACALQMLWGLQPCPMCILQRYALLTIAVTSLLGVLSPNRWACGRRWLINLAALAGVAASLRIQWTISVPSASCGRDAWAGFFNGLPMAQWWPGLFEATGICGDKVPPVLGVPFHIWALLLFLGLALLAWAPRLKNLCSGSCCSEKKPGAVASEADQA